MTTTPEPITLPTPLERFLSTLDVVHREGADLLWSLQRLFGAGTPDANWVRALESRPEDAEPEKLRHAERLGVLDAAEAWIASRNLRNRLVHEYQTDLETFAQDLRLAQDAARLLPHTYDRLREDAHRRLGLPAERLPPALKIKI